eukprot:symbB.v1.2.016740.t1/scaffold1277.1/size127245/4
MGLSVSSVGGQLLFIEATKTVGSGKLTVTGQLGKVMMESVETALSLLRSRFVRLSQSSPHVFNFETERMELSPGAVDEKHIPPFSSWDVEVENERLGVHDKWDPGTEALLPVEKQRSKRRADLDGPIGFFLAVSTYIHPVERRDFPHFFLGMQVLRPWGKSCTRASAGSARSYHRCWSC